MLASCGEDDDPVADGDACAVSADCQGTGGAGGTGASGGQGGDAPGCKPDQLAFEFQSFDLSDAEGATDFAFLPNESGDFLITAREGKVYLGSLVGDTLEVSTSWDVPDTVYDHEACGLTNLLLDPEFSDNGFVYVSYCTSPTNTRLVRYTWSEEDGLTDQAVIYETNLTKKTDEWHRFGSMGFEADGETLWMLVGDHFNADNGQTLSDPYGALIRILPNREVGGSGHEIPDGNMQSPEPDEEGMGGLGGGTAVEEVSPEVFAYGLRSPWRGTRDSLGRVFIADVGNTKYEEINLATEAGQNFGWSVKEGPCTGSCDGFTDPIAYFGRTTDDAYLLDDPDANPATKRAIWLGDIYENPPVDRYCGLMNGVVAFGDLFAGFVRGIKVDAEGEVTYDEQLGHLGNVTSWRTGSDGYAYALTLDGKLHRVLLVEPAAE
jgi:glucose/arabinose dehydrogenase